MTKLSKNVSLREVKMWMSVLNQKYGVEFIALETQILLQSEQSGVRDIHTDTCVLAGPARRTQGELTDPGT